MRITVTQLSLYNIVYRKKKRFHHLLLIIRSLYKSKKKKDICHQNWEIKYTHTHAHKAPFNLTGYDIDVTMI